MNSLLSALGLLALGLLWFLFRRERDQRERTRTLAQILDLADALERELRECRERLREVPALTKPLAGGDSALSAQATLIAEPQVQDALRDLLAHRLWLRERGADATLAELAAARDALQATRGTLTHQLERLADVRSDLREARERALS